MSQADELQALRILNRRLLLTIAFASRAIAATVTDAGLFLTDHSRRLIQDFQTQCHIIENTIAQSKEINHDAEQTAKPPNPNAD